MIVEQLDEIVALHRQQLGERGAAAVLVVGQDHLAHRADAVLLEEHVLGAAQADAFGAEPDGDAGIVRRVGIGAHLEPARPGRPSPSGSRTRPTAPARCIATLPASTWPVEPSMVMTSPLRSVTPPARQRVGGIVDADRAGAGDAGLAHAARHHRRMGGHAAAGGENALGGVHAVDVLGAGLDPHQDDLAPLRLQRARPRRTRTRSRPRRRPARPAARWRSPCARRRDRWSDAAAGRARRDRPASPPLPA